MAEYIERKALLSALKEEHKKGNFVFTSKWIKEIMDDLPTAEVAPKSEVAREIFAEIESKLILTNATHCGQKFYYIRLEDDIAELKKKYTEDGNE